MEKYFKKSRIQLQEILTDIRQYTQSIYNQSEVLYTAASPWGQILSVLANLMQMNLYYIEDSITELNIETASRPHNIYGLSRLTGHNPTRAIAASGDLFLLPNGTIPNMTGQYVIIPNLIKLKCKNNNLPYIATLNQDEIRINIFAEARKTYIKVIQGDIESQQFTGTGLVLQTFEANMSAGKWIDNYFVNIFVNSERWKKVDSFYDMVKDAKQVLVKTGITSGIDIQFGNGNFGKIPDLGSTIVAEYLITSGFGGNISDTTGIVFEFDEPGYDIEGNEINLNEIFNIGIYTAITFGSNPEPVFLTRMLAPTTSRSFVLANTGNYISFFEKMQQFSYINVYTDFDYYDPVIDNMVFILLIPDIKKRWRSGENYFTVPFEKFMLTDLEKFKLQSLLEESGKKVIGAIAHFVDPAFKRYVCNIWLNTWQNYDKNVIYDNVISKLSDYMTTFKRNDYLPKSDLIAILENIDGIDSVSIEFVSEDIEKIIKDLVEGINNTDVNLSEENFLDLLNFYDYAYDNNIYLSITDKLQKIFSYEEVIKFIGKHIDTNGDLVLSKNEIPLLRGGWSDRNNRYFSDTAAQSTLGSVNIYYVKENVKTIGNSSNKLNINDLRG